MLAPFAFIIESFCHQQLRSISDGTCRHDGAGDSETATSDDIAAGHHIAVGTAIDDGHGGLGLARRTRW